MRSTRLIAVLALSLAAGCGGAGKLVIPKVVPGNGSGTAGLSSTAGTSSGTRAGAAPVLKDPSTAHTKPVTDFLFAPDGRTAKSTGYDRLVLSWDLVRGGVVGGVPGDGSPLSSSDGTTSQDGTRRISWDGLTVEVNDLALRRTLWRTNERDVTFCRISPDGRQAAIVRGNDTTPCEVRDVGTGSAIRVIRAHGPARITAAAFSPDGTVIATGDNTGGVAFTSLPAGAVVAWAGLRPAPR